VQKSIITSLLNTLLPAFLGGFCPKMCSVTKSVAGFGVFYAT